MTKKRKVELKFISHRSLPVEVIAEDVTSHPMCLHGPTLLFSCEKSRYFACSSCRNKKDCTIHIDEDDWKKDIFKKRNEKYYNLITKIDKNNAWKNFKEFQSQHPSNRGYCNTCQELFVIGQSKKHGKDHRITTPLSNEQVSHPSSWLQTLENDDIEAQYIFSKKSVSSVLGILRNNNIKNILCIGTPSIHEAAQDHPELDSILLDYDKRHHMFNEPNKFLWYNMFNNYLFNGNDDEKILNKFYKNSKEGGMCIVIDPPFGGRVEPLVHTIREISTAYSKVCGTDDKLLPVIWAFPYFSEPYIKNLVPDIKMHDYQVEYENHKKFQNNSKGRKFGSPIRFFTNLPFTTIDLSNDSKYKLCEKCKFWVSANNNHCNKCKECTSKNGMTYKHCNTCKKCVKPTFFHCKQCGRCCLEKGHVCGVVVDSQSCYICNEKGHKQVDCPLAQDHKSNSKKRKPA